MALQNTKICHDFFYDAANDWSEHRHRQQTCYYRGTCFFSYNTQIAQRWTDNNGVEWLFVEDNGFSATTRQQISALIWACPFNDYIRVPFDWNDDFTPSYKETAITAFNRFKTTIKGRFEKMLQQRLTAERRYDRFAYKKDRDDALELLRRYYKFCEVVGLKPFKRLALSINAACEPTEKNKAIWKKVFAKHKAARAEVREQERVEAEREEKERRRLAEEAAKWIEAHPDKMEVVHILFDDRCSMPEEFRKDYSLRQAVRNKFAKVSDEEVGQNGLYSNYLSFVWLVKKDEYDNDPFVHTSQGVRFDVREARLLIKRWHCDKVTVGQHAGSYTIQLLNENYVQIGCHQIPIWNILGLEKELESIDDQE